LLTEYSGVDVLVYVDFDMYASCMYRFKK
jgi:hypothetical protein